MRIYRRPLDRYRHPRRQTGCVPLTLFFGLLAGILVMSWGWLGQRLQRHDPTPQRGDLGAAQQAFNDGDLDRAIEAARRVLENEPTRFDALSLLARSLIYRSYSDYDRGIDREVALEITTAAIERQPNNPDILAIHAYTLQANGKSPEAYRAAERALLIDPQNTLARLALGLSYGGVGSYESALREIQQAAQSQQWQLDVQRALAISYSDLGRYREAGEAIERALTLNDSLMTLYFEQALYALQIGDSNDATVAYFKILASDPDNVKARLRMCELSSMLREPETALNYCREVTERAPSWSEGWYKFGREHFLQGNYREAQQALNRCSSLQVMQNVPIEQRRFECWYLQGQSAEILGDCPALLATYNEFRTMAAEASIPQTWIYPPEGPPGCSPTAAPR